MSENRSIVKSDVYAYGGRGAVVVAAQLVISAYSRPKTQQTYPYLYSFSSRFNLNWNINQPLQHGTSIAFRKLRLLWTR